MPITDRANDIAIVGMSCRLPGARDVAEYWQNLCAGVESIAFYGPDELIANGAATALVQDPSFVPAFGALADAYAFDAPFFRVGRNEATAMDPQQRVFLECAWTALEDAGCDPERFDGAIGVFAGSGLNAHYTRVQADAGLIATLGDEIVLAANNRDFLTTLVSYKLGLRGPSVVVQSACSTSLVAVHIALQSLLGRECDLALAGGVSIATNQIKGYQYQEGGIRSRDGHCRPFDADATGMVKASGAGVVVLKRLKDALRDGDAIRAVLKGSAINNDGADKIGFAAPSVTGQAKVIAEALAVADVDPSAISYIETHGTGTPLGDPIEIAALRDVFATVKDHRVALGAVKSNIGHVDTAAGVAGLIKTVLALEHRTLPPTLHFQTPNRETHLDDTPFVVNTTLRPWDANGARRCAGISSFGIGGTNAHVVVEEAPARPPRPPDAGAQLLVLSARSETALERMRQNLLRHLSASPELPLADVAGTLQEGRVAHPHRWAAVATNVEEAKAALLGDRRTVTRRAADVAPPVAFLFPGQGAQYAGMVRDLYDREPSFRIEIEACLDILGSSSGLDVRSLLLSPAAAAMDGDTRLQQTSYTQPALFTVEYALARLWMSWGIEPEAMLGHSLGEYVAACLAGVFSLDAALRLVAERGRLMQAAAPGAMVAVRLPEDEVRRLMPVELSLAAVNGPADCVVSGSLADIERFEASLGTQVPQRRMPTSRAFHSAAMEPILEAFDVEVRKARPAAARIPFLSNVTGTWITSDQARDPAYWTRHLRQTVQFATGLRTLMERPERVLLEVGPGDTLALLARRAAGGTPRVIVTSLSAARQRVASDIAILEGLGTLWTAGVAVDWSSQRRETTWRRIPLPTYPFERTEYRVPLESRRDPDVDTIMTQQRAIMRTQAELLRGRVVPEPVAAASSDRSSSHGPYRAVRDDLAAHGACTPHQAAYLDEFVREYTARTRRSKDYAAVNRPMLADNRAVLGFRRTTKELVYPIVGERSEGARIWDADGNEYIDFTMGFGVHLFGHRPRFIVEAVEEQLRRGVHVGSPSDLAGPAARLLCTLTGMERATFCTTGSEAIMTAVRLARAATERDRIVIFEDSYHGTFDGVLARRRHHGAGESGSRPVAPGTPQRMVDDVVVLPYGTRETLDWLAAQARNLAAIVVEPAQSRHLERHPHQFLRDVRALATSQGTVLIFDEMITGFRLGARGAQQLYGIDADLATYGKVIGGGFPLAAIAGRAHLMDAIDGGPLRDGHDGDPAASQTCFAGTFCQHPMALAAACAVLRYVQQQGPSLYDALNARTARLVDALRQVVRREQAPVKIESCGSRFTFRLQREQPFAPLLIYHLLQHGIYVWEGRGCFLSTAHTDADCDRLVEALRASLTALRRGDFLPARTLGLENPS